MMDLYPQVRAVLHQLLQREAAAGVYRADAEVGAGGVPGRGHRLGARRVLQQQDHLRHDRNETHW